MTDDSAPGGLLRIGILILGLGLVSVPFWQGPLRLDESRPPPSLTIAGKPCPSGVGVEPYCYDDSADSIGVGSELLAQFFGVRRNDKSLLSACGTPVRAMIATLPDPTTSHLTGDFDAFLYALSRAHEHVGYSIDRFRIWGDSPGAPDTTTASLGSTGPWAILFRKAGWLPGRTGDTATALSLVYLVGETPTAGLDKVAFRRALNDLSRLRSGCPGLPLKFIGPYFSGAVPSWGIALRSLGVNDFGEASLVSGSATSPGNLALEDLAAPVRVRFSATVNSDSAYQQALTTVLTTMGLEGKESFAVAQLTEGATAYGLGIAAPDRKTRLTIPFPLSIATIRAAFDEKERASASRGNDGSLTPRVSLGSQGLARYRDVLPTLSPATIATQEIFLDQIAQMLADRGVVMLGIQATDVLDKLFLARELHRRLPHLKFYTFESNALYLRPDYQDAMRGMLVFSSYSLTGDVTGSTTVDLFPSDAASGVYNATLIQLGHERLVRYDRGLGIPWNRPCPPVWVTVIGAGVVAPLRAEPGCDTAYAFPAGTSTPVSPESDERLWTRLALLALLVALAWKPMLRVRRAWSDWRAPRPPVVEPVPPDTASTLREPGVFASVLKCLRHPLARVDQQALREWFEGESRQYGSYAWATLVLAVIPLFVVVTVSDHGSIFADRSNLLALLGIVPLAICLAALVVDLSSLPRKLVPALLSGASDRGIPELVARFAVDGAALLYLVTSVAFIVGMVSLPSEHGTRTFFWARARALDARVSPLLVVLLVGLGTALWCLVHRHRTRQLAIQTPLERALMPSATPHTPAAAGWFSVWGSICQEAHSVRWRLALLVPNLRSGLVLVLCIPAAAILWKALEHSLESALPDARLMSVSFQVLLVFGLLTGLALILVAVERLISVWRALSRVLAAIDSLPLRSAFASMPPLRASLANLLPRTSTSRTTRAWQKQRWVHLQNLSGRVAAAAEAPRGMDTLNRSACAEDLAGVIRALDDSWAREPTPEAAKTTLKALEDLKPGSQGLGTPGADVSHLLHRSTCGEAGLAIRAAEECVAAEVIDYVDWGVGNLRWIAVLLVAALLSTALLLFVYPIAHARHLQLYFFVLLAGTMATLAWVAIDLNRNALISRITRTTPGKLTWDRSLASNLFLLAIPLLGYLGTIMPGFRNLVLSWLQPLASVVAR